MRATKAKAIRRIAKMQAEKAGIKDKVKYKVTDTTKVPVQIIKDNQPQFFIVEKTIGPTKLVNCERAMYKKLKRLI